MCHCLAPCLYLRRRSGCDTSPIDLLESNILWQLKTTKPVQICPNPPCFPAESNMSFCYPIRTWSKLRRNRGVLFPWKIWVEQAASSYQFWDVPPCARRLQVGVSWPWWDWLHAGHATSCFSVVFCALSMWLQIVTVCCSCIMLSCSIYQYIHFWIVMSYEHIW